MSNEPSPGPRKRQRSASLAASSSSSKRALSAQPEPNEPSDADVPMADATNESEPPAEKLARIEELKSRALREGETWYLVSKVWYGRWERAMRGEETKDGPAPLESEIGCVDNASILDAGTGELSKTAGGEAEYVPQEAWDLLVRWYGEPQPAHIIGRLVILRGQREEESLELYPPRIRLFKVTNEPFRTTPSGSTEFHIPVSASQTLRDILPTMAETIDPTLTAAQRQYRAWQVDASNVGGAHTWPSGRIKYDLRRGGFAGPNAKLIEEDEMVENVEDGDAFAVEFMSEQGKWIVDPSDISTTTNASTTATTNTGATGSTALAPAPMFGSGAGPGFFDRLGGTTNNSSTSTTSTTQSKGLGNFFSKSSSASAPKKPITPGTLGLGNLGNTCFMNSALQCLAHTQELASYFLADVYNTELNTDNPLGMGGAVATAFGSLLHRIWDASSTTSSYSPRDFKQVVGRFAPQFSGYQQHDTQELVAFLLDGLHEDLNRVLKKPYVEKPDWHGGGDKEMVALAEESWEGYMKRNDSVIVDLFQNMYRSTLVCPECNKVSITFDPFMYLTLPLPVHKTWSHTILYVPLDPSKPHVKIPVEISRDASFRDLRALLAKWMGAPAENLMTMEVFSQKFYKTLHDNVLVSEMSDNDVIMCYELPCNALPMSPARTHQKKKARAARSKSRASSKAGTRASTPAPPMIGPQLPNANAGLLAPPGSERGRETDVKSNAGEDEDDEDDEPFILSVLLTKASHTTSSYSRPQNICTPLIVAIPRAQATRVQDIERVVVDALARWTTIPDELYSREEAVSSAGEVREVDGAEGGGGGGEEDEDEDEDADMEPVRIEVAPPPQPDAVTEIAEDGAVTVRVQSPPPPPPPPEEEGDIADAKGMVLDESEELPPYSSTPSADISISDVRTKKAYAGEKVYAGEKADVEVPVRRTGVKPHVFTLGLVSHVTDFGANAYASRAADSSWSSRESSPGPGGVLLREDDQLVVELEENMVDFLFGSDTASKYGSYAHPEYLASQAARAGGGGKKVITLQDCLDEFTKEEMLGQDDLWYCPGCKKHQQASKKFDLWGVPDVLVVHLKRFSSSRTLRDKIDEFVEFPVRGLDLTGMAMEREVRRRLAQEQGGLSAAQEGEEGEERLLYDLFAVDEHLGGLGGGHYRAYALNHGDGNWYHFDDSHVSLAQAEDAVNSNAYLLFYRRRTTRPLGGKTHDKISVAQTQTASSSTSSSADAAAPEDDEAEADPDTSINTQLPTPPSRDTPPHTSLYLPRDRDQADESGSSSPPALHDASPEWSAGDLPSPSSVEADIDGEQENDRLQYYDYEPVDGDVSMDARGGEGRWGKEAIGDMLAEITGDDAQVIYPREEGFAEEDGEGFSGTGIATPPPDSQDSLSSLGKRHL